MSLATNYGRLRDAMESATATRTIHPSGKELEDALRNFDLDIRRDEELTKAILREHYAEHADAPRFCRSEVCRRAVGEW